MIDEIPMLKPFVALLLGIASAYYLRLSSVVFLFLFFSFLSVSLICMLKRFTHTRWIIISSISIYFSFVAIGGYIYSIPNGYQPIEEGRYTYTAVVKKIISQKTSYSRCFIEIISIQDVELKKPYTIISNIYSDEILPSDTLYAQTFIKDLSSAKNAGQFDLQKYYGYKYIYQTTNISLDQFSLKSFQGVFNFQRWCFEASLWCKEVYEKWIPHRSAITMQALLLGVKNEISDEMMEVYMNTGVMHVLAVSGMHVGILYLGMMLLLRPIYKRWKYISLLPILLVWIFSFITGGGPAILRAAVMITFIDIGQKLEADQNNTNLLFVSGVFLLMFQPYLIWDIGFQLSFAAMLGLFYFMKPIQNIVYVKSKLVQQYVWSPSVMSISAQLATTPLTFFYFGNFPILFILTNLVILLPITIALYGGVVLLVTSVILPDAINVFLGRMIDFIVYYGFDAILQWMVNLPAAYTNQIYLSIWQVFLLSCAIFCFGIWLYQLKNAKWLLYALGLCFITVFGSFVRQIQLKSKTDISILHIPQASGIAVDNYLWSPHQNSSQIVKENGFALQGYLREKGWKKWIFSAPDFVKSDSSVMVIGNHTFYYLNESINTFHTASPIEVDYLILGKDLYLNMDVLNEKFHYKTIILDGHLDFTKYNLFKKILNNASVSFWDTRVQGALELQL